MVRARHHACGGETRVRLPVHLPAGVVRRVVCRTCAQPFDAPVVEEVELLEPPPELFEPAPELVKPPAPVAPAVASVPARRARFSLGSRVPSLPPPPMPTLPSLGSLPEWVRNPRSRVWRYLSIPIAAIAVIAALTLIQGSDGSELPFERVAPVATEAPSAPGRGDPGRSGDGTPGSASFVRESSFSLALPSGWERTSPSGGATFAAASEGGDADATLWVERDPKLSFASFEARSLDQLRALAGSSHVVERVAAPTPESTVVRLAADAPAGSPTYEVTLRASGPYRYYLATTVQPDASREALEGAELIQGSFVPSGAAPTGSEG